MSRTPDPHQARPEKRHLYLTAAVAFAVALLGCQGDLPLMLRLTLSTDDAQSMRQVAISLVVDDDRSLSASRTLDPPFSDGDTILLLLPDAWEDRQVTVELSATIAGKEGGTLIEGGARGTGSAVAGRNGGKPTELTIVLRCQRCADGPPCSGAGCPCQQHSECDSGNCDLGGATPTRRCLADKPKCTGAGCPCEKHAECDSGICDLYGAAPTGQCVAVDAVCFVDADADARAGGGSQALPYATIEECVVGSAAPFISVARGDYDGRLDIKRSVQIIAPGTTGSAFDGTHFKVRWTARLDKGEALLKAEGKDVHVVIYGISFDQAAGHAIRPGYGLLYATERSKLELHNIKTGGAGVWGEKGAHVTIRDSLLERGGVVVRWGNDEVAKWDGALDVERVKVIDPPHVGGKYPGGDEPHAWYGLMVDRSSLRAHDVVIKNPYSHCVVADCSRSFDLERVAITGCGRAGVFAGSREASSSIRSTIRNSAIAKTDVGIQLRGDCLADVYNATVADAEKQELLLEQEHGSWPQIALHNSIVWSSKRDCIADQAAASIACGDGLCRFDHSDLCGVPPVGGNIRQPPLFAGNGSGLEAYRLRPDSPCVDAGDDSHLGQGNSQTDLAGDRRAIDYHPGGAKVDMGAYELH